MIYLISGLNPWNRGIKPLYAAMDTQNIDSKILLPIPGGGLSPLAAAKQHDTKFGDIISIMDALTNRINLQPRSFTLEDFAIPQGYQASEDVRKFVGPDNKHLIVDLNHYTNMITAVTYFENDTWVKREVYDDFGWLSRFEFPTEVDELTKRNLALDSQGNPVVEYTVSGKYQKLSKIIYLPENKEVDGEVEAYGWMVAKLIQNKKPEDKIVILDPVIRAGLSKYDFNPSNVYLINQDANIINSLSNETIMNELEKYSTVIFEHKKEADAFVQALEGKSSPQAYWNNYDSLDHTPQDYTNGRHLFIYLGIHSEEDMAVIINELSQVLDSDANIRLYLCSNAAGTITYIHEHFDEAKYGERVETIFGGSPEDRAKFVSQSDALISYIEGREAGLPDVISFAISSHIPIIHLPAYEGLEDFVTDDNSKTVERAELLPTMKAIVAQSDFREYAKNPAAVQEAYSTARMNERWTVSLGLSELSKQPSNDVITTEEEQKSAPINTEVEPKAEEATPVEPEIEREKPVVEMQTDKQSFSEKILEEMRNKADQEHEDFLASQVPTDSEKQSSPLSEDKGEQERPQSEEIQITESQYHFESSDADSPAVTVSKRRSDKKRGLRGLFGGRNKH